MRPTAPSVSHLSNRRLTHDWRLTAEAEGAPGGLVDATVRAPRRHKTRRTPQARRLPQLGQGPRHDGNMVWNGTRQHRSSSASIFALQQPVTSLLGAVLAASNPRTITLTFEELEPSCTGSLVR